MGFSEQSVFELDNDLYSFPNPPLPCQARLPERWPERAKPSVAQARSRSENVGHQELWNS
jgi:hypothetical protein